MSNKILESLTKLDPSNDNHWTQDGMPRLDTVKILAGDPSLTREQITAAAPDFNRQTAQAAAGTAQAPAATPVQAPAPAAPAAPAQAATVADSSAPAPSDPPLTAPAMAQPSGDAAELRAQLDEAMLNLNDRVAALHAAQQAVTDAQNEIGRIENMLAKLTVTTENPIAGYLAQQQRNLEERAARKELIKESGLDLKELAKNLKAPIDAAMERKNSRGAMRPRT